MARYDYLQPRSIGQALRLKREIEGSCFCAGGTDILVRIKTRSITPRALISLSRIDDFPVTSHGDDLLIDARTRISSLIDDLRVRNEFPLLASAASVLGSRQIRSRATIGGNLCNASPCADTALPLLVYEAKLILCNEKGSRPIELVDFFEGPGRTALSEGELLVAIILSGASLPLKGSFVKKARVGMDLAKSSCALACHFDGERIISPRIAVGSLGPRPMRLRRCEDFLKNRPIGAETPAMVGRLAGEEVQPIDDIRSTGSYRRVLASVLVERSFEETLAKWRTR